MIKSNKIYSPQEFIEALTGDYYYLTGDNDIESILRILDNYADISAAYPYPYPNYPLCDVEAALKNSGNIVLVDCKVYNEDVKEFESVCHWFEVPENF